MITDKLCLPALLYIGFTLTHIVIDLFKKLYNTALLKFILMIIFTVMLNLLCKSGLTVLSWIIVFLPFIFMSIITAILIFAFGINPEFGLKNSIINKNPNQVITADGSIVNTSSNFDPLNNDFDSNPMNPPVRTELTTQINNNY